MVDKQGDILNYQEISKNNKTVKATKTTGLHEDEQGILSTGKKWVYGDDFEEESKKGAEGPNGEDEDEV